MFIKLRNPKVPQFETPLFRRMQYRKQKSEADKVSKLRIRMEKALPHVVIVGYEVGWCCKPSTTYKQETVEEFIRLHGILMGSYMNFGFYTVKNIYENARMPLGKPIANQLFRMIKCEHLSEAVILIRKGA